MIKKILKIKFSILIVVMVLLVSVVNLFCLFLFVSGPLEETKIIVIENKLSIREMAQKLEINGIINYPQLFYIVAKFYSINHKLKSGEYVFTKEISPLQVLQILSTGKSVIHKLIIPEGSMVSEIIEKINLEDRLFGEIKGTIPEGFLMPSTYFFSYGDQKEQIIEQMRKGMSIALDEIMKKLPLNSILKTRIDVLTLASIVEKEAALDEERPLIAAVFLNRLKKGMKLQADPTSIYAITEGKFKLARSLTRKDLALESPYNTYYVFGLPPKPIACPGIKSLQAVVNPAKTNDLFFVVNGKGGHNFSNNLNDHNENVREYRSLKNESKEQKSTAPF